MNGIDKKFIIRVSSNGEKRDLSDCECVSSELTFDYHINEEQVKKHDELMNEYSEIITPCKKTIVQLSAHVLENYMVESVEKENVITYIKNSFKARLSSYNINCAQTFDIIAYKIKNDGLGKELYRHQLLEHEETEKAFISMDKDYIKTNFEETDIAIFMEPNTDYFDVFGSQVLADKLVLFLGVNEEDIKTKNGNFLYYLTLMQQYNLLPKTNKFKK